MKKIKVIHVAQANGGVEKYLEMFFKYCKDTNFEHQLIVSELYRDSMEKFIQLGVKLHFVPMDRNLSLKSDVNAMIEIMKIIKKEKPRIVYAHSSKAGGVTRLVSKLSGCITIYNPHGWAFDMSSSFIKRKLYILIERFLGFFTDKVIAISNYEASVAISNKIINKNKIIVIENGIDQDKVVMMSNKDRIVKELGWCHKDNIVGMVARLCDQKSPETFVKLAEIISKECDNCKFLMVGDGPQRKYIEEIIQEKGLSSKIHITGWVENPEYYIACFDVALLTSKWEGFGLVIPEYMLHRKPVVASNVGGITDIIKDQYNGYLIDNLNEDEFAEKVIFLLNNETDRINMVNYAYEIAKIKYDFRRVQEQHITLFRSLLNNYDKQIR